MVLFPLFGAEGRGGQSSVIREAVVWPVFSGVRNEDRLCDFGAGDHNGVGDNLCISGFPLLVGGGDLKTSENNGRYCGGGGSLCDHRMIDLYGIVALALCECFNSHS